jgi:tungstate transport system ATP-binding protein
MSERTAPQAQAPQATPPPAASIALTQVGVRYGGVVALHPTDLHIAPGEFIALIGANGSGKTTLLQALHGRIAHSGVRVVATGAGAQAMVYQRPFMLRLSVGRNLLFALWLARVPAAERAARAEAALQRAGLAALRERPARSLSGGQQQRLALARAWAVRPSVLFLDEPTANLDPSAKREVEALLAGFKAEGLTVVMSTHNLGQAKRLATRVVYLDRGTIEADLPTARFFGEHLAARAESFLKGELPWESE